jgi:hypothetical protein
MLFSHLRELLKATSLKNDVFSQEPFGNLSVLQNAEQRLVLRYFAKLKQLDPSALLSSPLPP